MSTDCVYFTFCLFGVCQDYAIRVLNHITQLQQMENQVKVENPAASSGKVMLDSINNNNVDFLNGWSFIALFVVTNLFTAFVGSYNVLLFTERLYTQ